MSEKQPERRPSEEELTAYLDGELDAASSQALEEQLVRDPLLQAEVAGLDRAWSMLETLPRAEAPRFFASSTLEMVALTAERDISGSRSKKSRLGPFWPLAVASVLILALGGYAAGRWIWPDPNRQLLKDLAILEHLDAYRKAGNIDYLRRLEAEGYFAEGPEP